MQIVRTLAATAFLVAFAQTASAASMAMGSYECWSYGEPRLLMNFTVTAPGIYKGSDNSLGKYTMAGSNVNFTSGTLNGVMPPNFVVKYEIRKGMPTISFVGPSGSEAQYCEHVK